MWFASIHSLLVIYGLGNTADIWKWPGMQRIVNAGPGSTFTDFCPFKWKSNCRATRKDITLLCKP